MPTLIYKQLNHLWLPGSQTKLNFLLGLKSDPGFQIFIAT